ncbi:MAG: hypothetical protein ACLVHV_03255 [Oscillospiraceae bacterium]
MGRGQEDESSICVLNLREPAAPAFCSFLPNPMGGSIDDDLLKVAVNMKNADPQSETAKAMQEYLGGNHGATHTIAYQEIMTSCSRKSIGYIMVMTLPGRTWEHLNVWGLSLQMKFDAAEVSQIIDALRWNVPSLHKSQTH